MEGEKWVAFNEGSSGRKLESLGLKLRRGISVGKSGGPCTPMPSWKLEPGPSPPGKSKHTSAVSARKLGASLWEVEDLLPLSKTSWRRTRLRHLDLPDLSVLSSPEWPQSGTLRRHVAASLAQHHKLIERSTADPKPVSPSSYSSSMEIAAFNQAITASSSLDLKGRVAESGYNIKTSAGLLNVLNRIWSLEEQHASSVSSVKAIKVELNHAQSRIQELMQEQQAYHHEMDDLLKRVSEDRLVRKTEEQNRIKAAVQSIKNEIEDERKLQRRSESLNRKLGKELSEVDSALKKALNDRERERKARSLLEDLCDEFAKGVGDCEQEVRELKQKFEKDSDHRFDRLILHISEAWLDERLQMKIVEARGDLAEKNTILDRLIGEIMTFLQARRSCSSKNDDAYHKGRKKDGSLRRHSVESVHLNGAVTAPQDAEDDDSVASDLHCFELNMDANDNERHAHLKLHGEKDTKKADGTRKSNFTDKEREYSEKNKGHDMCSLKVQFEEQADRTELCNGNKMQLVNRLRGIHSHADAEGGKIHPDNIHRDSCNHFSLSRHFIPVDAGNASDSGDIHNLSSLVQQWNYQHASSSLEISECSSKRSSKLPQSVKENSLKEQLLEARLGQHARLRASKSSSVGGIQQ